MRNENSLEVVPVNAIGRRRLGLSAAQSRFDRRQFLLTCASLASLASKPAPQARPNILFIAIDDLNDWVGPLGGYPGVLTPNIDRLAERGVTFYRAYSSAPECNPSRVSVLVGLRPDSSGVYFNSQRFREILPNATTLPQLFRQSGYRTMGGGKVFHGQHDHLRVSYDSPPAAVPWINHDYDARSWDSYHHFFADPLPAGPLPSNGLNLSVFDWGPYEVDEDHTPDGDLARWASDVLSSRHHQPFFLAVGFYRPHLPWYVPRKYYEAYKSEDIILPTVKDDDLEDVPEIARTWARGKNEHEILKSRNLWGDAVRGYLASITFADAQLGRVLDALYEGPNSQNTIVILWSDHGWHLGEKLHWRKFTLWEEATRVPFIVAVPGLTPSGARCERTVSLLDIFPTLAELCHLPAPSQLQGHSLVALLRDPQKEWSWPAVSVWGPGNYAVRTERWRYIRYDTGEEELYDHSVDPHEWHNLALKSEFENTRGELSEWLPSDPALSSWQRLWRLLRR